MPKQVIITNANDLANVPLPNHGTSYTTITHKFIIDETLSQLSASGFIVNKEEYCRNLNGEIALGIYHLQYGNDPDMGLMFTWANSYDKTMRFRCAIGAHTHLSEARIIAGDISNYGRIHTGDAIQQVKDHIKLQIQSANSYFNELVQHKDEMKGIILTELQIAELMGTLYFTEGILTSSQLINVKEEYKKPSYDYGMNTNSLWVIYNHIIVALKKAHPKKWMERQKELHALITTKYLTKTDDTGSINDPNQINLLDQIEELESINAVVEDTFEKPILLSLDDYDTEETEIIPEKVETDIEETFESLSENIEQISEPFSKSNENISDLEEPTNEFPEPPADLAVYDDTSSNIEETKEESNLDVEELVENSDTVNDTVNVQVDACPVHEVHEEKKDEILPLEEQVAGEKISEVTPEEKIISKEPVINKPKEELNSDLGWLEEGPAYDENFEPDDDSKNTNTSLVDDLDFEF